MVLLALQLLQPMTKVCYICLENICALANNSFFWNYYIVLFYRQGMMCFWGISVVWFLGNMSTRTYHHVSKFIKQISMNIFENFQRERNEKNRDGKVCVFVFP